MITKSRMLSKFKNNHLAHKEIENAVYISCINGMKTTNFPKSKAPLQLLCSMCLTALIWYVLATEVRTHLGVRTVGGALDLYIVWLPFYKQSQSRIINYYVHNYSFWDHGAVCNYA